jgi:ABC-type branched-subunit amino acid transport system substrate-binding protein
MIQDDSIFRLAPHDFVIGKIMAHVVFDYGIESIVILERDDTWASGVGDWFVEEYESLGAHIIDRVEYPASTTKFSNYLNKIEYDLVKSNFEKPGIFLLSSIETSTILNELVNHQSLVDVTWFGSEKMINSIKLDSVPEDILSNVKLISPQYLPAWDTNSLSIAQSYQNRFGEDPSFYDANIYDSCMVLGLSVIEIRSANAGSVAQVLPNIANNYTGLTGSCGLDEYGDRKNFRTGIFTIGYGANLKWLYIGYLESPDNKVIWE